MVDTASTHPARARWAAAGAAIAISLGGGGMLLGASADSTAAATSFVPITPCRLLDTRAGADNVGARSTPLGAGETLATQVTGANGACSLPSGATAVSMNVTMVRPTASSFLTVFPSDTSRPRTANLNWIAGQPPTPNAVTADLSADGKVSFYNLSGTVDLAVDVVGYYVPDTAPDPAQVVWVAASGGDFTTLTAALASITDASAAKPYVVKVAPGVYTEPDNVVLKSHVDIEGSGAGVTTITCACDDQEHTGTLHVTGPGIVTTVSALTVVNTGGSDHSVGVGVVGSAVGEVTLDHVSATATGGAVISIGLWAHHANLTVRGGTLAAAGTTMNTGVFASQGEVVLTDVTARAADGSLNYGVFGDDSARVAIEGGGATATGSGTADAIGVNVVSAELLMTDAAITATGGSYAIGVRSQDADISVAASRVNADLAAITTTGIDVQGGIAEVDQTSVGASGTGALGIKVLDAIVLASDIRIDSSTTTTGGLGIDVAGTGTLTLRSSSVVSSAASISSNGSAVGSARVADSQLSEFASGPQPVRCITSFDDTFALLNGTCTAIAP